MKMFPNACRLVDKDWNLPIYNLCANNPMRPNLIKLLLLACLETSFAPYQEKVHLSLLFWKTVYRCKELKPHFLSWSQQCRQIYVSTIRLLFYIKFVTSSFLKRYATIRSITIWASVGYKTMGRSYCTSCARMSGLLCHLLKIFLLSTVKLVQRRMTTEIYLSISWTRKGILGHYPCFRSVNGNLVRICSRNMSTMPTSI